MFEQGRIEKTIWQPMEVQVEQVEVGQVGEWLPDGLEESP
jgi:hypothetical protein